MRRLLPLALLAFALGCQFERLQQVRVGQDIRAVEQAMTQGRPLPPLSSDPGRYGPYRPLMEHLHRQATRLQALMAEVKTLSEGDSDILRPACLVDAGIRRRNHERLATLVDRLGEAVQVEDALAGPAADRAIEAMTFDPAFKRGVLKGLATRRQDIQLVMATLAKKQAYYRKIDDILTLADARLEGLSPEGKLLFRTQDAVAAYQGALQGLIAFEEAMNRDVVKVQALAKAPAYDPIRGGPRGR